MSLYEISELKELNRYKSTDISKERILKLKSGYDKYSNMKLDELIYIATLTHKDCMSYITKYTSKIKRQQQVLRWICRGLNPDIALQVVLVQASIYE